MKVAAYLLQVGGGCSLDPPDGSLIARPAPAR